MASCGGSANKQVNVSQSAKSSNKTKKFNIPKGENSYFYYLMSEIKNEPETFQESDAFLNQAMKKDNNSSYLWAQKAINEARNGNWDVAINYAQQSLQHDAQNIDSLILLGKLYAARQDAQKAISYYKKALAIDQNVEEIYNVMAREYNTLGDESSAIHILKRCLDEIPESMSCLYYLATLQLQNKNYQEGLKYFNIIQQLNPENPKILQTIAEIQLEMKDYREAILSFKKLQQVIPGDVTITIRLALIYYEMQEIDHSITEFLRVSKRFPKSDRVNYFLGLLYLEKKNLDESLKYFDRINSKSTFFQESMNRILLIYRMKKDVKGALDALDRKVDKKDQNLQFYSLKVYLLINDRDYKEALSTVDEGLQKHNDDVNLMFQRAVLLEKLGKWEEAQEQLKKINVEDHSMMAKVYNFLGYTMLTRNENSQQALEYITKANEYLPQDGHIVDSLGWAYYQQGQYQQALSYILKAIKLRPDEPTILEHLGDVYFQLKNKRNARIYYEKALNLLNQLEKRSDEENKQVQDIQNKLGQF